MKIASTQEKAAAVEVDEDLPVAARLGQHFEKEGHLELGAAHSLGIHCGTFRLSEEGQDTPIIDLAQARLNHDVDEAAFRTLLPGKAWTIDRHPITHPEP